MNWIIDIVAVTALLAAIIKGWRKGFRLALLGVIRTILAYTAAYFLGRYLGYWLGEVANRPRIISIPVVAGLTFATVIFIFHIHMTTIRHRQAKQHEDDNKFRIPLYNRLGGSLIDFCTGLLSLIFILWIINLFTLGTTGHPLPGSNDAKFSKVSRRAIYEATYRLTARKGRESQAAATARVVSNPAEGMEHLQNILEADSVQHLINDRQFAQDLMSGDSDRLEQNRSLQHLFNDRETLDEMKALGIFSGEEKKSELCRRLSRIGQNERIRTSLENLRDKDLLHKSEIMHLIRDPDFDIIVAELAK